MMLKLQFPLLDAALSHCRFVLSRPLIGSTVIGATSSIQLSQLSDAAAKGSLSQDVLDAIDSIHQQYPNPTP